jgi:hypothetical protein
LNALQADRAGALTSNLIQRVDTRGHLLTAKLSRIQLLLCDDDDTQQPKRVLESGNSRQYARAHMYHAWIVRVLDPLRELLG